MGSPHISTQVSELSDSRVRVEVQVSAEEVGRTVERAALKLGRNLRVSGFRRGKVPAPVIIKRIGRPRVLKEAAREGVSRWYVLALDASRVAAVGEPAMSIGELESERQPLSFSFEVCVCPKATLGRYKGLEVGRREAEVDEGELEAELQAVRERHARAQPVDRPAQRGDMLIIDFAGTIDGEPFEGGRGRDQMIELGGGALVPGFEEQLEGASAGDERTVEIDFPETEDATADRRASTVSGRRATFAVTVKQVLAKELPELDDALAEEAGLDSLEALREEAAERVRAADAERVEDEFREAVVDAAAREATTDLPAPVVDARAREMLRRKLLRLDYQGISKDVFLQISGKSEDELLAEARPLAAEQLRREAVLAAVIEAEGIEVSDADVLAERRAVKKEVRARRGGPPPDEPQFASDARPNRLRLELARTRAVEVMAASAVAIPVEEAKASGRPYTGEPHPSEQEWLDAGVPGV